MNKTTSIPIRARSGESVGRRDAVPMQPADAPSLGRNLRRIRQERGLNLSYMAQHIGLPQSTLSKIENGQMSLNYDKLVLVAAALKIDPHELFATDAELARPPVSTGRRIIDRYNAEPLRAIQHYEWRFLCTELKDRRMVPYYMEVGGPKEALDPDNPTSIRMAQLIGERFVYVLEGPVEFHSKHYSTAVLQTGDSLYVDAEMPHAFVSSGEKRAKLLAVITSGDEQYLEVARLSTELGLGDVSDRLHAQRQALLKTPRRASRKRTDDTK